MSRTYSFRDSWVVPVAADRARSVLVDLEHYGAWWPQVVAVAKVGPDDARVLCRSSLPYTLDLHLHAVHRGARLLETSIDGDLVGSVRWILRDRPEGTALHFEQDVTVAGWWLGVASYLCRPLLRWNHDQMMAGCRAGLTARLRV